MSVEATWDLHTSSSPRSLCIFSAPNSSESTSNNPFDAVKDTTSSSTRAIAAVFGTEIGSLHYRTYAAIHRASLRGGLGSTASASSPAAATRSSLMSAPVVQSPLGSSGSSATPKRTQQQVPRSYFPIDLKSHSLPGSVVACLQLTSSSAGAHNKKAVFLLLVDDGRGAGGTTFAAHIMSLHQGAFHHHVNLSLPRMSCAAFDKRAGLVFCTGRTVSSLPPEAWEEDVVVKRSGSRFPSSSSSNRNMKRIVFDKRLVPAPGARSGQDGIAVTANGNVAVVAVSNAFYAVAGSEADEEGVMAPLEQKEAVKILSLTQSSQVHPAIVLDLQDESVDQDWSCIFLANGRECAAVDMYYGPPSAPRISFTKPRNGNVTLASPILAAASSWPWIAILTSDGLISVRSPSCMAIPLRTVEVGTQPNDYFVLRALRDETQTAPWIIAAAYSGEGKVLQCQADSAQDLADRLMRLAIDAFGANGFPRAELADALHASFTATSYVGPEATPKARSLLQQYLEAVLGLTDWESGGTSGWPTELSSGDSHHGTFGESLEGSYSGRGAPPTVVSAATPAALLTGSALLCLVCMQLNPPNASLANRAAKSCAEKMGVVIDTDAPDAARDVCEMIADKVLREAPSTFSLLSGSSPAPIARGARSTQASAFTEFIETAIWLLRACGKHERAIEVAYERLHRQSLSQVESPSLARGAWSQLKYESYTATHLSELWASGSDAGRRLVIRSPATYRLLEQSPRLGLSVFTSMHPQNESQWEALRAKDDPLAKPEYAKQVVKLLKSANPSVPSSAEHANVVDENSLPLESGRALAVSYLESAIGVATGRPTGEDLDDTLPMDPNVVEKISDFHDELSFLLLEGVISERRDDQSGDADSDLGKIYRSKLRRLLRWPLAKIRSESFMNALPASFLQEKALVLGRLGRHEDALRILYRDLHSLDLALEYCDDRHEQLKAHQDRIRARQQQTHSMFQDHDQSMHDEQDNAYLPLVRVALESDDKERGTAAAIQVLALRRSAIDRAAALRLLPSDVPVSAVARPFLIPALVDSESQVRRLTVVSSLLRARYHRLKTQLTSAQLKAQSNLQVVPQLRSLNLGDPLHSTNPFRARTSGSSASNMPDVMIVKHFFPRHLIIQAKVTNPVGLSGKYQRTLGDIAFVVAESSEEAIQPMLQVPIQELPPKLTGCAWCVLSASPDRMDGPAQLTCELRYSVQSMDTTSARTYVEELQDLEVHASHFRS